MQNRKIRTFALILALVMVAAVFTGCGSGDKKESSTAAPSSAETPVDSKETPTEPEELSKEGYEISILTISHDGQIIRPDHPNFETLKEHTGYDVRLEYVLNSNYEEQINTRLASGDLPGLVVITGNNNPIVSAAKSGAFWDITDVYKDYPNLAVADENVMNNISIEGRYYGIYRSRIVGRNGISYRSDWLENLGLEPPETLDDLYEVLRAFTYDDPDGNGQKDTYGMTWCTYMGPFINLAVMHGAPNYWGLTDEGKLYPWFESEAYIEAMDYSKRLYDEELINQDFAALQTSEWDNDFGIGRSGIWVDVADAANRHATKLRDNGFITQEQVDDGEVVWVMGAVENSKGERHIMSTPGHAGYVAISQSGAPTEEDLHHYLTFMDACNDEVGQNILNYGTENVTYEVEDDFVVPYMAEEIVANVGSGFDVTAGWNQFMMNTQDLLYKRKSNPRVDRQVEVQEANLEFAVHDPTLPLMSDTYTGSANTLEQIIEDATINYIMGKNDLDGFQKEVDRWYNEGGQASLDEYQASYDSIYG